MTLGDVSLTGRGSPGDHIWYFLTHLIRPRALTRYVLAHTHTHTRARARAHTHTCTHTHTHAHSCIHTHTDAHSSIHTHTHTRARACACPVILEFVPIYSWPFQMPYFEIKSYCAHICENYTQMSYVRFSSTFSQESKAPIHCQDSPFCKMWIIFVTCRQKQKGSRGLSVDMADSGGNDRLYITLTLSIPDPRICPNERAG